MRWCLQARCCCGKGGSMSRGSRCAHAVLLHASQFMCVLANSSRTSRRSACLIDSCVSDLHSPMMSSSSVALLGGQHGLPYAPCATAAFLGKPIHDSDVQTWAASQTRFSQFSCCTLYGALVCLRCASALAPGVVFALGWRRLAFLQGLEAHTPRSCCRACNRAASAVPLPRLLSPSAAAPATAW